MRSVQFGLSSIHIFFSFFLLFFFFYRHFPWQTLTIHRIAGKREGILTFLVFHFHSLTNTLHKKWSFPLRISSVNVTTADLTEEILNGKLHFLCNDIHLVNRDFYHFCLIDLFVIARLIADESCSPWRFVCLFVCLLLLLLFFCFFFAFSLMQLSRSYWLWYFQVTL